MKTTMLLYIEIGKSTKNMHDFYFVRLKTLMITVLTCREAPTRTPFIGPLVATRLSLKVVRYALGEPHKALTLIS